LGDTPGKIKSTPLTCEKLFEKGEAGKRRTNAAETISKKNASSCRLGDGIPDGKHSVYCQRLGKFYTFFRQSKKGVHVGGRQARTKLVPSEIEE